MLARNYDRSPDRKPRRRVQRAESFPSGNQSDDDCQRDNSPNECSKLNLFLRLKRHRSCAPSELPFHLLKALERVRGVGFEPTNRLFVADGMNLLPIQKLVNHLRPRRTGVGCTRGPDSVVVSIGGCGVLRGYLLTGVRIPLWAFSSPKLPIFEP